MDKVYERFQALKMVRRKLEDVDRRTTGWHRQSALGGAYSFAMKAGYTGLFAYQPMQDWLASVWPEAKAAFEALRETNRKADYERLYPELAAEDRAAGNFDYK